MTARGLAVIVIVSEEYGIRIMLESAVMET